MPIPDGFAAPAVLELAGARKRPPSTEPGNAPSYWPTGRHPLCPNLIRHLNPDLNGYLDGRLIPYLNGHL